MAGVAVLLALMLLIAEAWGAFAGGGEITAITAPVAEDLYAVGRVVRIEAPVRGDLTAAGGDVTIAAPIAEDLIVAGESIAIGQPVGDDLRAAGRRVHLDAAVGDHLLAAGETVTLGREATTGGFAWLAGREVIIGGRIGGDLKAWAQQVIVSGEVAGDAEITAERLQIRPGARIGGDLVWHGRSKPELGPGAVIGGRLIEEPLPGEEPHPGLGIAGKVFFALTLLVAGAALFLLFPDRFAGTAEAALAAPLKSLGLGFALLVATPVAIALLFVTVVGWLLALLALVAYLLALPVAWFLGAFVLARIGLGWAGRRESAGGGQRLLALTLAIVLLLLVQIVPWIGPLAGLAALLIGLGGIALGYRRCPEPRG